MTIYVECAHHRVAEAYDGREADVCFKQPKQDPVYGTFTWGRCDSFNKGNCNDFEPKRSAWPVFLRIRTRRTK